MPLNPSEFPVLAPLVDLCLRTPAEERPQNATELLALIDSREPIRPSQAAKTEMGILALNLEVALQGIDWKTEVTIEMDVLKRLLGMPNLITALKSTLIDPSTIDDSEFALWVAHRIRVSKRTSGYAVLRELQRSPKTIATPEAG